ncbi:AAA family ATPase [Streptomyces sp. NPDC051214]|uniref:BREX system ATP-binding domain-containing protein n=1 Tax=Streptomyces sp. NPDC051214 TaxID=3155282 RepID=UPI003433F891
MAGREQVLAALSGHLDAAARGSGNCVIVEGPFGAGKSRLLKAAVLEGAERGLAAVSGRVNGTERPAPTQLLINLLRHVMPGEAGLDDLVRPGGNPFWLTDRMGELVEHASRRHPLLIVLDDVHAIDDASALVLRGLVQSLAASPVLWIFARRPMPTRSLAHHAIGWLAEHAAVRLRLGALDDEAVASLCTSFLGAKPDATVLSWAARCGGNPWLVESLLDALVQAGEVVVVKGTASVVADRLPEGFHTAVGGLLDALPPAARRLLTCGQRIGRTFTVEKAAALLDSPAAEVSAQVEELVQAGLLHRDGPDLGFAQKVIEEALQQTALHEETAAVAPTAVSALAPSAVPTTAPQTLRSLTSVADALADPTGDAPSVVTSAASPRAGSTDRGCDCDDLTARALSALGDPFDEVPRALAPAVRLLASAGRSAEAGRLADLAVRPGIEAAAETHLALELGHGLRDAGRHGMSAELLQRTLARHDVCELDRAKLKGAIAGTAKRVSALTVPGPWRGQPVGLPSFHGPGGRDAACGNNSEGFAGRIPARAACGECGEAGGRPLWTWLLRAFVAADRFEEASAVCAAIKQEAEKRGTPWPEPLWYGHHAQLLASAGRLEEARAEADTALRLTDPSAPQDAVPARLVLARISMHRGDLATAGEHVRTAQRLVTGAGAADKAALDWALAQLHAVGGRPATAVQVLVDAERQDAPDPLLFAEAPTAAATLVRLAKQVGLGAEAERAADLARRLCEGNPTVQSAAGAAEHAEGVLRGDPAALHRAVELHRLAGRPLAAGSALEDAAHVEQSMQNRPRAVRLLESAMDLYLDCGAQRDAARVQKKLRHLGVHNVRGLGADIRSGWESLTSAELRVVRAIVDGRTNREAASILFLSPHTVDSHLRRVFSKLDINSRVELTKHFIANEPCSPEMTASRQHGSAG